MLKLLGSICIFGGGVMLQWIRSAAARRELMLLRDLSGALGRMAEELRLSRTPLPRLLEHAGGGACPAVQAFLRTAADAARRGEMVPEVWRSAAGTLPISAADRAAVAELGACLCGDEMQVCKGISLAKMQLERSAEALKARQPEQTRRNAAFSLSAAALLVILLI